MPLLKSKLVVAAEAPKTITTSTPTPEQLGQVAAVKKTIAKASAKAASETMSKADWHDKDVRISRQGLFQACLQSVGLLQLNTGNDLKSYLDLVKQAAEEGLKFVNEK
jgi:hypothetical protein